MLQATSTQDAAKPEQHSWSLGLIQKVTQTPRSQGEKWVEDMRSLRHMLSWHAQKGLVCQ